MTYLINNNIIADDVTALIDMGKYYLTNARLIDGTACHDYIDVVNFISIKKIENFTDLL